MARLSATHASIETDVSLSMVSSISLAGEAVHATTKRSVPSIWARAASTIFSVSIISWDSYASNYL